MTYDPVGGDTAGRTVELVGGSRYLPTESPGLAAGTTLLYTTSWAGTLTVDPGVNLPGGPTTGGAFVIDRTPDLTVPTNNPNYGKIGAISVTAGAAIDILAKGVLDLGGVNSLYDGTNGVAVTVGAGAQFNLTNVDAPGNLSGRLTIGGLTLAGTTNAWTGLLNVGQTGLTILGGSDATIRNQIIQGRVKGATDGILTSAAGLVVGYEDVTGGVEVAAAIPGDVNLDGRVDINDLTIVLANYGKSAGMTWGTGDIVYDGTVDINDLTIVLANYGQTESSMAPAMSAVPEPSVLALLAAVALGLLAYGWRRRV
jgi:hypothetical protein